MSEIAAIILAAGRGIRFGSGSESSKVLAPLDGKPLLLHVVEAALASRCSETIVVTGHAAGAVAASLVGRDARLVHNANHASGMASSLKTGIAALPSTARGVVVLLADMPLITPTIIDQLIACFEAGAAEAVVPTRQGRRGNPVLLGRSLFVAIAGLDGDEGARKLLASRDVREVGITDAAIASDIDTPDALARLREAEARESSRDPAGL